MPVVFPNLSGMDLNGAIKRDRMRAVKRNCCLL